MLGLYSQYLYFTLYLYLGRLGYWAIEWYWIINWVTCLWVASCELRPIIFLPFVIGKSSYGLLRLILRRFNFFQLLSQFPSFSTCCLASRSHFQGPFPIIAFLLPEVALDFGSLSKLNIFLLHSAYIMLCHTCAYSCSYPNPVCMLYLVVHEWSIYF